MSLPHWTRTLWPLPVTALGLCLAACARLSGARWRLRKGVVEVCGGRVGAAFNRLGGRHCIEAMTLGHVVLARDARTLRRWRRHERVHVRQYERWGIGFLPAYGLSSLWQWSRGRCPYRDNRFERAAYQLSHPGRESTQAGSSSESMP